MDVYYKSGRHKAFFNNRPIIKDMKYIYVQLYINSNFTGINNNNDNNNNKIIIEDFLIYLTKYLIKDDEIKKYFFCNKNIDIDDIEKINTIPKKYYFYL